MEVWKTINKAPKYQVSDHGRIRHGRLLKIVKTYPDRGGYQVIRIKHLGFVARVHRIVAEAFIANFSDNLEVDHRNCVRHDNRLSNLVMSSRGLNMLNTLRSKGAVKYIIDLYDSGYSIEQIQEIIKENTDA